MKKLLIPVAALAMALPAMAQELSVISSVDIENGDLGSWTNTIEVPEAEFAKVQLGNTLRITGVPSAEATVDAPAQVQLVYKDEDWTWTPFVEHADIEGDHYDFVLEDEEIVDGLILHGLFMKGQNFTVTNVSILGEAAPATGYEVLGSFNPTDGDLNGWNLLIEVPETVFADMKVGDAIRIKGAQGPNASVDAPAQVQLAYKDEDWTWTQIVDSDEVIGDEYMKVIEDEEVVEGLKLHGLFIKGQNFIISTIECVRESSGNPGGTELVEVSNFPVTDGDLAGWTKIVEVPETAFADAKLGDIMRIYGTISAEANEEAPAQVQLVYKDEDWTWTQFVDSDDVLESPYEYKLEDETILEGLKLHGLFMKGQNFTVESVSIWREQATGGDEFVELGGMDVADGDLAGWSKVLEIPETVFADAELGSIIKVDGVISPEANEEAPAQVQLAYKDEDWTWTQMVDSDDVLASPYEYKIEDQAVLDGLKLHGLCMKGQNFTVTRVSVWGKKTTPDDPVEPAEYVEIGFFVPGDGYVGYTDNGDAWSEVVAVPNTLFVDCAKTDRIRVEGTNLADAQIQLAYKDENWDWTDLVECADFVDGMFEYELTGKKGPAGLTLHGLFIKGQNLEVTRVSLWSCREISGVGQVFGDDADLDAPVEIYTIQGVRVSEMNHGIYIIRQGSKVRKVIR